MEDDHLLGKAVRIGLEQLGHQVDWLQQGAEVASCLRLYTYDVLLLDLGLPDADGVEVLRLIRQQRRDIPVLIITARDQINDRIKGLALGADDFMVKPVDLDEMAVRLRAITRRRAGRSAEAVADGAPVGRAGDGDGRSPQPGRAAAQPARQRRALFAC